MDIDKFTDIPSPYMSVIFGVNCDNTTGEYESYSRLLQCLPLGEQLLNYLEGGAPLDHIFHLYFGNLW